MAYVYVAICEGRTKIGIAKDVEKRRRGISTASGAEVAMVASRQFADRKSAWIIEQDLHRRFAAQRGLGEWFTVDPALAVAAMMEVDAPPRPEMPVPQPTPEYDEVEAALAHLRRSPNQPRYKWQRKAQSRRTLPA